MNRLHFKRALISAVYSENMYEMEQSRVQQSTFTCPSLIEIL